MSTDDGGGKTTIPSGYADALQKRGFRIEERVGQGAYGSVYRATQESLGRRVVAAKFFDRPYMSGAANRKRFEREAPLLALVEHPSIPYVITAGTVEPTGLNVPYTVMQFVRGEPLDQLIKKQRRLKPHRAVKIIMDVLAPLACAHAHKVIHRDIKPDNIIVGEETTYLIDFSIGICLKYQPGLTRPTGQGQVVGTPEYASKEQLKDSSNVDHRTDLYSAGIVLFEMLAGHSKIDRAGIAAQLPGIPAGLHAVILRACAPDRVKRYADAVEFRQALEEFGDTVVWRALEPMLSVCRNVSCSGADWSPNGYLRGPHIDDSTSDEYCQKCGKLYLKYCPKCRDHLPPQLHEIFSTSTKGTRDTKAAHCGRCGTLIFQTPTCMRCGSFLKREDVGKDTRSRGCSRNCATARPRSYMNDDRPY